MLTLIGIFETGCPYFSEIDVYDFRDKRRGPALWAFMEFEQDLLIVLLPPPPDQKPIGRYFGGKKYLKWNSSIKLTGDIRLVSWWPGTDVSRSGQHGTQHYAGLATYQAGTEWKLSVPVSSGSIALPKKRRQYTPWGALPKEKGDFDIDIDFHGLKITYRRSRLCSSGSSPDHQRRPEQTTTPTTTTVQYNGQSVEILGEYAPDSVYRAIKKIFPNLPSEVEAELFLKDICRSKINGRYPESGIQALVTHYRKVGLEEISPLFEDCIRGSGGGTGRSLRPPEAQEVLPPDSSSRPVEKPASPASVEDLASKWGARIKG